jgi:hypothetical protein
VDVVTGRCIQTHSPDAPDASVCADAGLPLLEDGRLTCAPSDATCPRGSRRAAGLAVCERSPRCPAGSVADGSGCRAIVTVGGQYGGHRVDVGAWAALVLGFDGGSGSRELCQPLQQNSASLTLPHAAAVQVAVSLTVPDQDISRVRAEVQVVTTQTEDRDRGVVSDEEPPRAGVDLQRLASADVATLLEALRGLGGEATAAAVEVRLRCELRREAEPP